MGEKDHSHSPCTTVELGDSTRVCCWNDLATNKGECEWFLLAPSPVGPLSVFHHLLVEVAGCRLDAQCGPLVVMRFVVRILAMHCQHQQMKEQRGSIKSKKLAWEALRERPLGVLATTLVPRNQTVKACNHCSPHNKVPLPL